MCSTNILMRLNSHMHSLDMYAFVIIIAKNVWNDDYVTLNAITAIMIITTTCFVPAT